MSSQMIGNAAARVSEALTSQVIRQCSGGDLLEAIAIASSISIPPIMILAGMISKRFAEGEDGIHPGSCADEDSILLACLVLSRAASPAPFERGVNLEFKPETFADAMADFAKLKPLTSIDSFVRSDLVNMSSSPQGDGAELLAGILSKRIN